jgi:hypothetical protein
MADASAVVRRFVFPSEKGNIAADHHGNNGRA